MDNTLGWINITLPPPERLAALRRRILDWYVSALESLTLNLVTCYVNAFLTVQLTRFFNGWIQNINHYGPAGL